MKYLAIAFMFSIAALGFSTVKASSMCYTEACQIEQCLDNCSCSKGCSDNGNCAECCAAK